MVRVSIRIGVRLRLRLRRQSGGWPRARKTHWIATKPEQCGRILGVVRVLDAPPVYLRAFLPRVPLCACTFYLIMTDAAVRMCVTRESSREEEVREIRRED